MRKKSRAEVLDPSEAAPSGIEMVAEIKNGFTPPIVVVILLLVVAGYAEATWREAEPALAGPRLQVSPDAGVAGTAVISTRGVYAVPLVPPQGPVDPTPAPPHWA